MDGSGKDVYLFDPNLGLPLPGPKGEGIATLAQANNPSSSPSLTWTKNIPTR